MIKYPSLFHLKEMTLPSKRKKKKKKRKSNSNKLGILYLDEENIQLL